MDSNSMSVSSPDQNLRAMGDDGLVMDLDRLSGRLGELEESLVSLRRRLEPILVPGGDPGPGTIGPRPTLADTPKSPVRERVADAGRSVDRMHRQVMDLVREASL